MTARIFKPAKNAMQSGRAKTKEWQLDYEPEQPQAIEPLMGWTSSGDMKQQLTLHFETKEEAVAYCERKGIAYQVIGNGPVDLVFVPECALFRGRGDDAGWAAESLFGECQEQDISKVRVALDRGQMTP